MTSLITRRLDVTRSLATAEFRQAGVPYQTSNPCWYRYEVLAFDQPSVDMAVGRVRI